MKITKGWFKEHDGKWFLRTSDNGVSHNNFKRTPVGQWNVATNWTGEPSCNACGGFFGIDPEAYRFGLPIRKTFELCLWRGDRVVIDGDKICVRGYKVVSVDADIPDEAFNLCGIFTPQNLETITPKDGEVYLIRQNRMVNISNQSGGYCWFHGNSKCGTVSGQSGGNCWFYGNSKCGTVSGQSGGNCWFYGNSKCGTVSGQSGGNCWFYGNSKCGKRE